MRRASTFWWAVAAVALTACAAGSGSGSDPPARTAQDVPLGLTEEERSTLDVLNVVVGSGDQSVIDSMSRTREAVTAECMRARGFEFIPATYEPGNQYFPPTPARTGEFMREYGYGVATLINQREAASALRDTPNSEPNLQYLDRLSISERDAYQRALYGEGRVDGEGFFVPSDPFGGCNGEGVVAGETQLGLQPRISQTPEFHQALGDLHQSWQSDKSVIDATQAWSQCMAESGYDLAVPESAPPLVSDWLGQLTPVGTTSVEVTDAFGARRTVAIPSYGKHVDDVIIRELELATADLLCDEDVYLQLSRDRALLESAGDFIDRWILGDTVENATD